MTLLECGGGNNTVVEGHGRLEACKRLGIDKVPVIRLDNLTDEQRRAYTLVHNQTTMSTGFDYGLLEIELGDIEEIDMEAFGFMSTTADTPEPNEVKEPEYEEPELEIHTCPNCGCEFED